jgi:hypothetical protein
VEARQDVGSQNWPHKVVKASERRLGYLSLAAVLIAGCYLLLVLWSDPACIFYPSCAHDEQASLATKIVLLGTGLALCAAAALACFFLVAALVRRFTGLALNRLVMTGVIVAIAAGVATVYSLQTGLPRVLAHVDEIRSFAVGANGDLFVALDSRVEEISPLGHVVATSSGAASALCWYSHSGTLASEHCWGNLQSVDRHRNLTVDEPTVGGSIDASSAADLLKTFSWAGKLLRTSTPEADAIVGEQADPRDRSGNRYEAEPINPGASPEFGYRILKISPSGRRSFVRP